MGGKETRSELIYKCGPKNKLRLQIKFYTTLSVFDH